MDDDYDVVDIGLFRISASLNGGTLQAAVGFLAGENGEARASLTGRLVDNKGRLIAIGDIHPQIIQALSCTYPFVQDFAMAHGCDSTGRKSDEQVEDEEKKGAWLKARKAWDTISRPIMRQPSP